MGLKAAGADLAFKTGLFNGDRWLAAFQADGSDGGNAPDELTNTTAPGYARIAMTLADWKASNRNYVNSAVKDFPSTTGAWPAITTWGLYDAATAGALLLDDTLGSPTDAATLGATVGIQAEALGVGFRAPFTQSGAQKACNEGLLSGTRFLALCTGNPAGNNDTIQNLLAGEAPIATAAAHWALDTSGGNRRARNNRILSFGVAGSNLARPTHLALMDGNSSSSKVLASYQFSPAAPDPDVGDTIQFNMNDVVFTLPLS